MKFNILTLFFLLLYSSVNHSIVKRAVEANLATINAVDIRPFAGNKHLKVDDYSYGGGTGLVMRAEPIYEAYQSLNVTPDTKFIYMSPRGKTLNQKMARELSKEKELVILCGHYEGVDQRLLDKVDAIELSIGDYVLTGGELAACVVIDAITRLLPGVLVKEDATTNESFENNLLEYPQYTRPAEIWGMPVPDVLLSGNHAKVNEWREQKSLEITKKNRPDLLNRV
jgi:tRNA (guanine37-N1)-methyltransferase